jgi:hypothetical protein
MPMKEQLSEPDSPIRYFIMNIAFDSHSYNIQYWTNLTYEIFSHMLKNRSSSTSKGSRGACVVLAMKRIIVTK